MGSPEDFPGRILHLACIHDNPDLLEDMLRGPERDNMNALDAAGRSVVYSAVSNRSLRCLRILLEEGADPNIPCDRYNGQTPLHQAALDGRLDLITILLDKSANIMARDNDSNLPLDYARRMDHEGCANLLKDAHDTLDGQLSRELENQLVKVAECDISVCDQLVAILDKEKVKNIVNTKLKEDRVSILYRSCILKRADLVRWLIDHGADSTYDPSTNQTPLFGACRHDCIEAARILLENFPELIKVATSESVGKVHCLHLAASSSLELVKLLMEWKYDDSLLEYHYTLDRKFCYKSAFDVNIANLILWSPLYFATASNKPEIVKYLLEYETMGYPLSSNFSELSELDIPQALANITEYIDQNQLSRHIRPVYVGQIAVDSTAPLHHAVRKGYIEVTNILIEHRADINQVCDYQIGNGNYQKFTSFRFAVHQGDRDMISLLLKNGVKDENSEILGTCFLENNKEMVNFILKHKAYQDSQHRISVMPQSHTATVNGKGAVDDSEGPATTDHSVNINWHGVKLPGVIEPEWIYECSHYINPRLSRDISVDTITVIDVSSTGITSLPPLLFKLRHLITLKAQTNTLKVLPPSEGWKVPKLKEIYLDHNSFTTVPDGLFSLPSLEKLSMCENAITSLQFSVWTAPKLMDLNLAHNQITTLCNMSTGGTVVNGRTVDMARKFSQDEVFGMDSVDKPLNRSSTSSFNQPKSVVVNHWSQSLEVIDELESAGNPDATLTNINLAHNKLHNIPVGLPCLAPKLSRLDLSHNNIHHMGSISLYPASLTYLNLSFNKLKKMVDIEDLDNLSNGSQTPTSPSIKQCYNPYKKTHKRGASGGGELNLPRNRSSSSSIGSITSLGSLLPCRHTSVRFGNLMNLNLSHNRLSEVVLSTSITPPPDQVDSDSISVKSRTSTADTGLLFPKLGVLDLSHNEIKEIPSVISEQSELNQLYLGCNLIKDLPPALGLLKSLWNMELSGCPLEGPLAGLVEMKSKTADIVGFLNSVLKDSKPYASMKLMIVGQANIGKTSLLSELRREAKNVNPFRNFGARVNNTPVDSKSGDTNLATVGVDIGDLTFDKSDKKGRGKVTFKTWDFGGQEEYYATHQYFLSKRSLYLILYKLTDGEQALENIKQWLVNIQTRSPGAPVIIVGSHFDIFRRMKNWEQQLKKLNGLIASKFININEPAMQGLPNVIDTIEVSSKTHHNVAKLATKIYDTAWALKAPVTEHEQPGGKSSTMALLEQRIPAIYIRLEEVVRQLSTERLNAKKNPVLTTQQYRAMVSEHIKFRDFNELNQATQFLHDNGVLLHYQDVALSDLYFLDPQWLCDMLAHVITIKEINRFVKSGIMKRESLQHLFGRSVIFQSDDLQTYIVSLLSKFELALVWDSENLLLPSLLPSEQECQGREAMVKIPMNKSSTIKRRVTINSLRLRRKSRKVSSMELADYITEEGNSTFYIESENSLTLPNSLQSSVEIPSLENSYATMTPSMSLDIGRQSKIEQISSRPHESIRRVYFLSYIPSGFWPRLISRIYRDSAITVLTEFLFDVPAEYTDLLQDSSSRSWQCWKTGLSLQYITSDLLKVKQIDRELENDFVPYYKTELLLNDGRGQYIQQDVSSVNILEVEIPDNVVEIFHSDTNTVGQYYTRADVRAKLLAKVVDHIEMLLEDWYPDLGERFIQNTRGEYLVQRLIICPVCLEKWHNDLSKRTGTDEPADNQDGASRPRTFSSTGSRKKGKKSSTTSLTMFSVEDILIKQYNKKILSQCKEEHNLSISKFAPDLVFGDIYTTMKMEDIFLGKRLGKGAFGDVYIGHLKRVTLQRNEVAVKMMQPHNPGEDASESMQCHYQESERKWNAELWRNVFTSYCNARQEINILNLIQHDNVVSFVGVLLQPLSLLLERAPCGSLQDTIEDYYRAGLKIPFTAIQQAIIQTARALDYLHNEIIIIYRDLKAENVLVWSMPTPHINQANDTVEVKLADFGVSRAVSDRTAKGYGGTRGYMAPEIIEFLGKEEYTEKVDCYSFSSFIYELMTLKRPFWHCDGMHNIESLVLAGKRPSISNRELLFPTQMLDLMTMCWSHDPKDRPSAEQIISIASQPQFSSLHEVVRADASLEYVTSCCLIRKSPAIDMTMSMSASVLEASLDAPGGTGYDMYMAGGTKKDSSWYGRLEKFTYGGNGEYISSESCELPPGCGLIVSCCRVDSICWLADLDGYIHVLPNTKSCRVDVHSFIVGSPGDSGKVKQLLYSADALRVFCLLQKGILIEYNSVTLEKISERKLMGTECNCMVLVDSCLWIGQKDAHISAIPVHYLSSESQSVSDWMSSDRSHAHIFNHFSPVETMIDTAFLVSDTNRRNVWSNVYPGAGIYCWDVATRSQLSSCNISTIISRHEQRQETEEAPSVQLTALDHHSSYVLVSTTCGYLIVLNSDSLLPFLCVKPYEEACYKTLYSIIPLPCLDQFLTVGVGYRSHLLAAGNKIAETEPADMWNGNMIRLKKPPIHILSWYINPSDSM